MGPYSKKMIGDPLNSDYQFGQGFQYSESPSVGASSGGGEALAGGGLAALGGANPYVLAATIGLGLLQQRAQDERQRRANAAQIEQQYAGNQASALNAMGNYWGRALKR